MAGVSHFLIYSLQGAYMVQLLVSLVLCFATSNLIAADVKVGGVLFKDSTDFNSSTVVRLGVSVGKSFRECLCSSSLFGVRLV